jgi:hypothetical protein
VLPPVSSASGELDVLKRALDEMMAGASPNMKVQIIAERRRVISEAAKISGPVQPDKIKLGDIEGYAEYEQAMFDCLEPYVEARKALADMLRARLAKSAPDERRR